MTRRWPRLWRRRAIAHARFGSSPNATRCRALPHLRIGGLRVEVRRACSHRRWNTNSSMRCKVQRQMAESGAAQRLRSGSPPKRASASIASGAGNISAGLPAPTCPRMPSDLLCLGVMAMSIGQDERPHLYAMRYTCTCKAHPCPRKVRNLAHDNCVATVYCIWSKDEKGCAAGGREDRRPDHMAQGEI